MIATEQQQQIDAAMDLLSRHVAEPPREAWMVELFTDAIDYAADMMELSADEILDYLEEQPLGQMAHAHVFEQFITTNTNDDGETILDEFMRTRLRQEDHFVRAYLEVLGNSELALWEITGFKAGQWADVRRLGSGDTPVKVPLEAKNLPQNLCIASRLLCLPDGGHTFSFGLLPIEREEAEEILAYLAQVRAEMLQTADSEAEAAAYAEDDIEAAIAEETADLIFLETLASWVGQGFEE